MESKRFQGFLRFVIPESFRWFYSLLLTTEGSCRLGNSSEWFPENSYRLFPLNSKRLSPVCSSLPQFAPVRPIYTQSQNSPRIHGVKFGSRFFGSSEAFSWVTVDRGKLRAATNGRMDINVNREVHTARTEFSRFDSSLYGLRLALIPKASST